MSASNFAEFPVSLKKRSVETGCRVMDCSQMVAEMKQLCCAISADAWSRSTAVAEELLADIQRLRRELNDHIAMMEGPGGMIDCVGDDCPRLTPQIRQLCREHVCIRGCLAEVESRVDRFRQGLGTADAVRKHSACLMTAMNAHQDTGNGMLLEAYSTDVGTGD